MDTRYLGRHELIMEIPKLTTEGERFNLEGPRFSPGTIGQVTQILAQNAGRTRIRVSLVRGKIISRRQASRLVEQAEREEKDLLEEEMGAGEAFERGEQEVAPEGGEAWWGDFDPRARSGEDSLVAEDDFERDVLGVDDWAQESDRDGVQIMIKPDNGSDPEPYKPNPPATKPLSSGDRDFTPQKAGAPGLSELVANVVGGPVPQRVKGAGFSQAEYAASMGMTLNVEGGEVGGIRKSHVPNFGTRFKK